MRKDASPEKVVQEIRRRTRRRFSAEEKIRIVREGLRGEASIATLCRKEGFGGAGMIIHVEELPDGRFNILLRGLARFRITGEDQSRPYRLAHVQEMPEPPADDERLGLRKQRQRLETVAAAFIRGSGSEPRFPPELPDGELVNLLAQHLELDPLERLTLLEREGALSR